MGIVPFPRKLLWVQRKYTFGAVLPIREACPDLALELPLCWLDVSCISLVVMVGPEGCVEEYSSTVHTSGIVSDVNSFLQLCDFHVFNFERMRWSIVECVGVCPGERENNGMVEHDGRLLLFGGYSGTQWLADFWAFNMTTRAWTGAWVDSRVEY
jgi:hypothetical protein